MSIDVKEIRQAISVLNNDLKSGLDNGKTFTDMEPDYIKKCHELLLTSSKSDNWNEIADEIAFFLYAGGTMEILFNTLKDAFNNQCVRLSITPLSK